jgi:hypothetical protein
MFNEKRKFFELADRSTTSDDADESRRLKQELDRMTFAEQMPKIQWGSLPPPSEIACSTAFASGKLRPTIHIS